MPEGMNRLDQWQCDAEFSLAGYPTNRGQRTILRIDSKNGIAVMPFRNLAFVLCRPIGGSWLVRWLEAEAIECPQRGRGVRSWIIHGMFSERAVNGALDLRPELRLPVGQNCITKVPADPVQGI